jgi:extracellular elastinolytic metalloproteinase
MRVSALLALLPALATLASAAPTTSAAPRKSLSFGPSHPHHKFESFPDTPAFIKRAIEEDPKRAAAKFIAHRTGATEGEGFFIREDSYTDPRTLVTHVYATQLIDGLEVGDGNINVNLDRDGNVLSVSHSLASARGRFATRIASRLPR